MMLFHFHLCWVGAGEDSVTLFKVPSKFNAVLFKENRPLEEED